MPAIKEERKALRKRLKKWKAERTALKAELETASIEEQEVLRRRIKRLKKVNRLIKEKLEEFDDAEASEAWPLWLSIRSEMEEILKKMGAGFQAASTSLDAKTVITKKPKDSKDDD